MSHDQAVSTSYEPIRSYDFFRRLVFSKQCSSFIILVVIPYRVSINNSERSVKHEIQVFKLHDMQIVCGALSVECILHNDQVSVIALANDRILWLIPDGLRLHAISKKHENYASENLGNEDKSFKNEPGLDSWVFLVLFMDIACYVLDVQDREQVEVWNQDIEYCWNSDISNCFKVGL